LGNHIVALYDWETCGIKCRSQHHTLPKLFSISSLAHNYAPSKTEFLAPEPLATTFARRSLALLESLKFSDQYSHGPSSRSCFGNRQKGQCPLCLYNSVLVRSPGIPYISRQSRGFAQTTRRYYPQADESFSGGHPGMAVVRAAGRHSKHWHAVRRDSNDCRPLMFRGYKC
jgi:hypothetical protein